MSYQNPQMNQPNMGMYQNFNQPMNNPYADRMTQLQNYQQNLQQPIQQQIPQTQGLIGRAVNDFSEIKADDVPMNGTPAVFIKNDMSEIEIRVWGKDGLIRPTTYKPILEQNQADGTNLPQNDFTALNDGINAFREEILARLDNIEKSVAKPTNSRSKKGDSENE